MIQRYRDGVHLRSSRNSVITLSHDGTVELCLANITQRDAGVYKCIAMNEVGKAETSANLIMIDERNEKSSTEKTSVNVQPLSDPDLP